MHGLDAQTTLTGEGSDISNLYKFGWYEWCYYRDDGAWFPFSREVLGRVHGPATNAGNEMYQWVLKCNGQVVPRRSLRPPSGRLQENIILKKRAGGKYLMPV